MAATVSPGHHGTQLSAEQVVACAMISPWWALANTPAGDWMTMSAIALAESSGFCAAVSPVASDGTQGFGVTQIESSHSEFGTFDATGSNGWQDPVKNFTWALTVYQQAGGSFKPWVTYQSGKYQMFSGQVQAAAGSILSTVNGMESADRFAFLQSLVNKVPEINGKTLDDLQTQANKNSTPGVITAVTSTTDFVSAAISFLGKLNNVKAWTSIGYVVAGAVILLLVGVKMLGGSKTVQGAVKAAVMV